METVLLPSWRETQDKAIGNGSITHLEAFIYEFEPKSTEDADDFRSKLINLLLEFHDKNS